MKDRYERYLAERKAYMDRIAGLGRRDFLKAAGIAAAATVATGKLSPHSFQPVDVVRADAPEKSFTFAYISDSHLYEKTLNERFVRAILKAIDDVNAMNPQPDFVFYGGDLAQLGQPAELTQGAEMLKAVKAPMHMMVGEHDWYFDMGEKWRSLFGKDTYSFDHKGVHFVVLNSVIVEDYWTAPKMTPMERMKAMAQLDNPHGRPFTVGNAQRDVAQERPGEDREGDAHHRLLPLAALQDLQGVELLDRRRGAGAADPRAVQDRERHPWPHPSDALEPDRQHPVPRHALDGLAVALCPRGAAQAHDPHEPRRSLRRV